MDGRKQKVILWLLLLMLATVPLVFSSEATLVKEGLTHLLATFMASLWLFSTAGPGAPGHSRPLLGPPLVSILGASGLSLLRAGFSFQSLAAFYQLLMFLVIYWMVISCVHGESQVLRVSAVMALIASVASLAAMYQVLFPRAFHAWYAQLPAVSALANTNHVGGYLITAIPLTFSLALCGAALRRAAFGALAVVAMITLVLTEARGAWVGFAGGIFIMVVLLVWRPDREGPLVNTKRMVVSLGLVVLLALAPAEFLLQKRGAPILSRVATIFDPSYPTNRFRFEWWGEAVQMVKDRPLLGVGIGNFPLARIRYARYVDPTPTNFLILEHPHNEYLHTAAETGLIGLLASLWLLFSVGRLAWRLLRSATSSPSYAMAVGFTGSLVGATIHSFFFYPWHSASSSLNLWVTLALLEALFHAQRGPAMESPVMHGVGRWGHPRAIAAVALLGLGFYWLSFKPFMADRYLQRGTMKLLFATPAEAAADLQKSLAWEDFGSNASMRLGEVYFGAGRYQEAIREFQRAVEHTPGLPTAYGNLGFSLYMAGQPERALEAYLKALAINPNFPVVHNNLGNIYSEEGRNEMAMSEYERAIALNPKYATAHFNLGLLLIKAGRFEEALSALQSSLAIDPLRAKAWYNLAAVQARLGREAEGREALTKAITLDRGLLDSAMQDPALAALEAGRGLP